MSPERAISAGYVTSMLKIAAERGVDCAALLESIGIDLASIERGEPVAVELYGNLYQSVANQLSQEWFGMLSGEAVPRGAIRYLCLLAVPCRTLEQAVLRCQDFFELCRGFKIKQTLKRGDSESLFSIVKLSSVDEDEFNELIQSTSPDVIKATMAVMHGFAEWLIGEEIPIKAMYYPFSPALGETRGVGAYPIFYNADYCGYVIDSAYLDYPVMQTEQTVEAFSRQAPYFVFIKDHLESDSIAEKVRAVLLKNQSASAFTAASMATLLNISATSLHRKLGGEDTTYQRIKDETRLEITLFYLGQPGAKTVEVAEKLGFESPGAFYRSFKKWTGMTLKEYRASLDV
jgi:AraC-like DNA-binding protein